MSRLVEVGAAKGEEGPGIGQQLPVDSISECHASSKIYCGCLCGGHRHAPSSRPDIVAGGQQGGHEWMIVAESEDRSFSPGRFDGIAAWSDGTRCRDGSECEPAYTSTPGKADITTSAACSV